MFRITLLLYFCRKLKQNSYHFVILSLFTILVLSIPGSALASSKSPYESGYDHGCDDAGISDSSDRYINQPEKGPAYHTSEFMNGYDTGYHACSNNYDSGSNYEANGPSQRQGINWYEICTNPIVDTVITEPCDTLVKNDGYELTSEGERVLWCIVGGGILTLAGVPLESLAFLSSSAAATGIC